MKQREEWQVDIGCEELCAETTIRGNLSDADRLRRNDHVCSPCRSEGYECKYLLGDYYRFTLLFVLLSPKSGIHFASHIGSIRDS